MKININHFFILTFAGLLFACNGFRKNDDHINSTSWELSPFQRVDSVNPILQPSNEFSFIDSIIKQPILWEEKDVFNPAAVVKDGKVYLLYRAEDKVGIYNGTSRIGLAESEDGLHFTTKPEPVFFPDEDSMKIYEWPGGCEDPRIVESPQGWYLMTYTAYDGKTARLCVATSPDLEHWQKKGLAFKSEPFINTWSKSGAVVCQRVGEKVVAVKINGKFWMYWGDTDIFLATSDNLIDWSPLLDSTGTIKPVLKPRPGFFDSNLVESGPPALLEDQGILLIYNSKNDPEIGDKSIPAGTYSAGQVLFDKADPGKIIDRSEKNFFTPEKPYEMNGQVNNVCFLEGLVLFKGTDYLYYGTADSKIAVAIHKENSGMD